LPAERQSKKGLSIAASAATRPVPGGTGRSFMGDKGNRLGGLRVAVTRPAPQSTELAEPLRAAGAQVLVCPLIKIESKPLDVAGVRALERLSEYDWIVLTSVNGVEQFMKLVERTAGLVTLHSSRFACVGPATARVLSKYGFAADVMPPEFVGESVAAAIQGVDDLANKAVLLPRASGGGTALPAELRKLGATVDELELYESVLDAAGAEQLRAALTTRGVDLVTFTSGSAVSYFVESVGAADDVLIAVIGPSTAKVARSLGLNITVEANPHTVDGLVQGIIDYFAAHRGITEA
jgi:uroporphyrinogen III methyltransferase/synthase